MKNNMDYQFDYNDNNRKVSLFDDPSYGLNKNTNDFPILDSNKNSIIFDSRKNSCNLNDSIFIDQSFNVPSGGDISGLNNELNHELKNFNSNKSHLSCEDKQGIIVSIYLS